MDSTFWLRSTTDINSRSKFGEFICIGDDEVIILGWIVFFVIFVIGVHVGCVLVKVEID